MATTPQIKTRPFDLRVYKKNLRDRYRRKRKSLSGVLKAEKDRKIFDNIRSMPEYTVASMVLCFVSKPEEINTHGFINQCLADRKIVAVPYCIDKTRDMDFYIIESLDQLEKRTYGVLEPVPEKSVKVKDFTDSICVIPGISFDDYGYRLGYGGGYYDRFLAEKFDGYEKIGVCYNDHIRPNLIHGRYDVPCDWIVTEKSAKRRMLSRRKAERENQRERHYYSLEEAYAKSKI